MIDEQATPAPAEENTGYTVVKREDTRWWKVLDPAGELCVPDRFPPRREGG
jgi:hypothetical protein